MSARSPAASVTLMFSAVGPTRCENMVATSARRQHDAGKGDGRRQQCGGDDDLDGTGRAPGGRQGDHELNGDDGDDSAEDRKPFSQRSVRALAYGSMGAHQAER